MDLSKSDIFVLLILVGFIILFIYIRKNFKMPKIGSLALITGAVKSGKSTFGVGLAISEYKRVLRHWRLQRFFAKLFRRPVPEKPLLYSNIPLGVPYVPLTKSLLLRQSRFRYKSVIYICECTLVADNLIFKDVYLNECTMLFTKLIGHETKGGLCVLDTQAIGDLPAVMRRCLGQYFYVHHISKWIPFFLVAYVKECRYSEDGSVVSVDTDDLEDGLKRVLLRKSVWKKFDCYCYSKLTDHLPVEAKVVKLPKNSDLSTDDIVSFREFLSK